MPGEPIITEMPISLTPEDLNAIGYVDATAYLKWVQAVVIMHWKRFAPAAAQASTLWIAVRHNIVYHNAGRAGDSLLARTCVKRLKGVRAVFTTIISSRDRRLAQVESTWVCLDAKTNQPKFLDRDVAEMFASTAPQ
jgi:acyl-CoA thioester hydrolase